MIEDGDIILNQEKVKYNLENEFFKDMTDNDILGNLYWTGKEMDREASRSGTYMNPDYHYLGVDYQAHLEELLKRGYTEKYINDYLDKRKVIEKLKQ